MNNALQQRVNSHAQFITNLKDLDRIHLACKGLPYGDKDQTLFIDDEPSKAFQNPKWNGLTLNHFEDVKYPKAKCNG